MLAHTCRAVFSQLRHVSTIGKTYPSKFQRVLRFGFITAATSFTGGQPNFARCLSVSWAATLCTHLLGLLPPDGILPAVKFTLRPSLAFSYIGSVTARHANSGRQPNFVAWYNEWNYGTFAEGATSAGRSSRWALVHILVFTFFSLFFCFYFRFQAVDQAGLRQYRDTA